MDGSSKSGNSHKIDKSGKDENNHTINCTDKSEEYCKAPVAIMSDEVAEEKKREESHIMVHPSKSEEDFEAAIAAMDNEIASIKQQTKLAATQSKKDFKAAMVKKSDELAAKKKHEESQTSVRPSKSEEDFKAAIAAMSDEVAANKPHEDLKVTNPYLVQPLPERTVQKWLQLEDDPSKAPRKLVLDDDGYDDRSLEQSGNPSDQTTTFAVQTPLGQKTFRVGGPNPSASAGHVQKQVPQRAQESTDVTGESSGQSSKDNEKTGAYRMSQAPTPKPPSPREDVEFDQDPGLLAELQQKYDELIELQHRQTANENAFAELGTWETFLVNEHEEIRELVDKCITWVRNTARRLDYRDQRARNRTQIAKRFHNAVPTTIKNFKRDKKWGRSLNKVLANLPKLKIQNEDSFYDQMANLCDYDLDKIALVLTGEQISRMEERARPEDKEKLEAAMKTWLVAADEVEARDREEDNQPPDYEAGGSK